MKRFLKRNRLTSKENQKEKRHTFVIFFNQNMAKPYKWTGAIKLQAARVTYRLDSPPPNNLNLLLNSMAWLFVWGGEKIDSLLPRLMGSALLGADLQSMMVKMIVAIACLDLMYNRVAKDI